MPPGEDASNESLAGVEDGTRSIDYSDRCHRLKKLCSAQTPAPPRKRKAPKTTRVAELEKRLDDLTARVGSRQPQPPELENGDETFESQGPAQKSRRYSLPDFRAPCRRRPGYLHIFAPDDPDYCDQHREQFLKYPRQISPQNHANNIRIEGGAAQWSDTDNMADENHEPSRLPTHQPQHSQQMAKSSSPNASGPIGSPQWKIRGRRPSKDVPLDRSFWLGGSLSSSGASELEDPWYYPSSDEARQFLNEFTNHLVSLFPFVVIPPNMTSSTLRRDRPLLWKAIMMQGLHLHARRQESMGDELLKEIAATAIVQSRKSFDLLQALEVFIAWFHMSTKSFQLTNLLFLLRSICVSLGFNESHEFSKQQEHTATNLEQMRAFTGVYYLVTMVFTTNKKPDAFMNTTYLDHCCRILQEKMEYPTDQLAVLLARTQRLSQSISMTLAFRNNRAGLPLSLIVQSFQHEIHQLRDTIPENLVDYTALKTQIHIAEILLYESGLNEDLSVGVASTDRLELLWKCLIATRSMLEARFDKTFNGRPHSIILASSDYTYAMIVCLKLSILQLPGWDIRLVRKELNFDLYLMKQIANLQQFTARRNKTDAVETQHAPTEGAPGSPGPAEFEDPIVQLHTRLSKLRVCILAELSANLPPESQQTKDTSNSAHGGIVGDGAAAASAPARAPAPAPAPAPGSRMPTTFGDAFTDDDMQGLDDPFWQDWSKSNEWETNFSAILGWGFDETGIPTSANWASDGLSH